MVVMDYNTVTNRYYDGGDVVLDCVDGVLNISKGRFLGEQQTLI